MQIMRMQKTSSPTKISAESARRIGGLLDNWRGHQKHEDLAEICGVTQGQVSKILAGKFTKVEGAVARLCELAGIDPYMEAASTQKNTTRLRLYKVLDQCWDGSKEQADMLISLLQSASKLANGRAGR